MKSKYWKLKENQGKVIANESCEVNRLGIEYKRL